MLNAAVLDYTFAPGNTYLVADTFGPSGQCLLGLMLEAGVKPVVCHVNYHLNADSGKAQSELQEFCTKNDLILEVCDTAKVDQTGKDKNYAAWQRRIRYAFFKEMYDKHNAAALFISHMQDDILEIYLTAKLHGIKTAKYGYSKVSTNNGMMVVRPLLEFTRSDLKAYCNQNNVPYLEAATGVDHLFTTEVRQKIYQMNEVERDQLLQQMIKENSEKTNFINSIDQSIKTVDELEIRAIIALTPDEFAKTIMDFVNQHAPVQVTITPKMLADIRAMALNKELNSTLKLKGDIFMVKEYDVLTLDTDGLDMPYTYVLDKPMKFSCETFDLDFTMGAEDRNIHPEDYPLTVRSVLPQDVSTFGGYLVSVRRMLAAAGVSARLLRVWPVFLNKDNKIIYVPHYKKGFSEYHNSILNIHVKNDEK
ncbi:MAG: tRNA lysidine(34) synthetase TilS [Bacilli bacterium]